MNEPERKCCHWHDANGHAGPHEHALRRACQAGQLMSIYLKEPR